MKNTLTYCLPFSFKGKDFTPTCNVDLDEFMKLGSLPCLYRHLANTNRIDVYSHEYDVMMMGDLEFKAAEGIAAEFIQDGAFDSEGFQAKWHADKLSRAMQEIASRHLKDELQHSPGLIEALLAAYHLGCSARNPS